MHKIYTRTGDRGETSLFGGQRVAKDSARIEAIGTVDELNAAIGLAIAHIAPEVGGERLQLIRQTLEAIQHQLFDLGAELAAPQKKVGSDACIGKSAVEYLERTIDGVTADLTPLKEFILPGGTAVAGQLHIARTIARRAERRVIALKGESNPAHLRYLNRLSDLLFTLARAANRLADRPDIAWRKDLPSSKL